MTPSRLQGCVFRGNEGDGTSFHCFHHDNNKEVTPGDCAACPLRSEAHVAVDFVQLEIPAPQAENKPESTLQYLAHGVSGLTKAALGIDKPSDEVVQKRWEICKSCEFHKFWRCRKCGCATPAKVRVASERCPIGLWGAENGKVD